MVTNGTVQGQKRKTTVVATIGKWMPPHNGHKQFLVKLAREHDKIIVMIGSCYESGTENHSIPAAEREKMIVAIFKSAGISEDKYEIIPVEDTETFEEWVEDVKSICNSRGVTHFCTGNQEDILSVLEKKNKTLGFEMINPEINTDFQYHATDIRKMIIEGRYKDFENLIPPEVKPILFKYSFKEILAASRKKGVKIVKGRQTVDMVFLIRNISDGKVYVLLGNRSMQKVDFPGCLGVPGTAISKHESAIKAVIRACYEKTGLNIELLDNSLEPAIIKFSNVPNSNLEQLHFIGIYSSEDEKMAGTRGGSSHAFGVFVEDDLDKYEEYLSSSTELTDLKFYEINEAMSKKIAYQQMDMIKKAYSMFEAYPDFIKVTDEEIKEKKETFMISFIGSSGAGKSTAGLGAAYNLKLLGKSVEYVPEFAKRLVYDGTLEKNIPNQSYIAAEQFKMIYDLLGQVDYIVTDAGLEITALHSSRENEIIEKMVWYLRNRVKNQITIFIEMDEEKVKFENRGRIESQKESQRFSILLEEYLKKNNLKYIKVKGSVAAVEAAINAVEEYEKNH